MRAVRSGGHHGGWCGFSVLGAMIAAISLTMPAAAQSTDGDLEELRYVRGLVELRLVEVLETYLRTNPPTDDIGRRLHEIHRQRMHVAVLDPQHDDRRAELQRLLQLQRNLIDRHGRALLSPIWRLDLATDIYFGRAASEVATITALVGLPSDGERAEAHRIALEILSLIAEARLGFANLLLACETEAVQTDDITWTILRDRLAREEGEIRMPILEGVGTSIAERAGTSRTATSDLTTIAERMADASTRADGSWAILGQLHSALLWSMADSPAQARTLADRVLDNDRAGTGERLLAHLAIADTSRRHDDVATASRVIDQQTTTLLAESPDDLLGAVLMADQRFMLRTTARPDDVRAAIQSYIDLESISTLSRDQAQVIALDRLARVSGSADWELADLPPIMVVASARTMLRGSGDERETAIRLLKDLLATASADEATAKAAALYELGRAAMDDGDVAEAIVLLRRLAIDHPTSPDAERAMEAALVAAASAYRTAPTNPDHRVRLDETLSVALDRYPNLASIDRWRYEAGRLAWIDGKLPEAETWFRAVGGDTSWHADAWFMRVRLAMRVADEASDATERRRSLTEALSVIVDARRSITRDVDRGIITEDRLDDAGYYLACLRIFEAEAEITLGHAERAIDVLEDIERAPGLGGAALGRAMRARIDAYRAIGQPAGAVESIRAFLAADADAARRAIVTLLAALQLDVTAAIEESRDADAQRLAERNLLPVARALHESIRDLPLDAASTLAWLQVADVYRHAGRHAEAIPIYDRLAVTHGGSLQILLGQAESQFGLGGEAALGKAMTIYRRLAAAGESEVGDVFWLSQLRMLQILDRMDRNTDRIAPRILQLRQRDPNLGTDRVRRGFEALGMKYR